MANEDEDVRKIQLGIEALRRSRASQTALPFTAELQALIDSEAAENLSWKGRLHKKLVAFDDWLDDKIFWLTYGYARPPFDAEATTYIEALHAIGTLSDDEQRACKQLRLPRRGNDGVLEVVGPPRSVVWLRWLAFWAILVPLAYSVATFLQQFFSLWKLAWWGFPIGAALGRLGRSVYYRTWGWKPLALKLRYTVPMLRAQFK